VTPQQRRNNINMNMRLTTTALAVTLLMGCAGTSPNHDAQFGQNARTLRAQQLIDPDAPKRNTGRGTTDGKTMAGAYKNFVEGTGYVTKEPSPPPPQVIVAPSTNNNR
jgi:hypothetical protein